MKFFSMKARLGFYAAGLLFFAYACTGHPDTGNPASGEAGNSAGVIASGAPGAEGAGETAAGGTAADGTFGQITPAPSSEIPGMSGPGAGPAPDPLTPAPEGYFDDPAAQAPMATPKIVANEFVAPSIWRVTMHKKDRPGDPKSDKWSFISHINYEYEFKAPDAWDLGIPTEFTVNRARLLSPPGDEEIKIIIVPWGIYDEDAQTEIIKAETSWLMASPVQSANLTADKQREINGRKTVCHKFEIYLADDDRVWTALASYIQAKPKCYAIILTAPAEKVKPGIEKVYNTILDSFVAKNPEGGKTDPNTPAK